MNTSTPIIEARDLTVGYGSYVVQKDLNFTINRQDVFIIMGPSGCGKSTLLRVLVGLLQPTKGQVLYRGQDFWAGTESERQKLLSGVGLLFQSGALWSSMTLAENVALPLQRYTKLSSAEIREQTSLKLALVGLAGFEDYYPSEISGGMRKRAGSPARWRWTPKSFSLTSLRPGSTRSAPPCWTSSSSNSRRTWA